MVGCVSHRLTQHGLLFVNNILVYNSSISYVKSCLTKAPQGWGAIAPSFPPLLRGVRFYPELVEGGDHLGLL